jgi:thiol-disulfide isomerase/thioredoxin
VPRGLRLLLLGLAVAGVAVIAVVGLAGKKQPAQGRRAPALPQQQLLGPRVSVAQLTGAGAHPALVVFWASWCGPCQSEAAALERFASGAGRGRMVGVDWSDAESGARSFIKRFGWSFPNVRDGEGTAGYAYGLTNLPTTFVLSREGDIRQVLRGPQDEASLARALATAERAA